jgi:A/G-specific adenine glycosylase
MTTELNAQMLRRRLLTWYRKNQRDLPWRRTRDPYRIWISEIMLQQTRVAAVLPYYERFLNRFPDVGALASAPEQELLAAWSGLGYYARARNVQRAAKTILKLGAFPRDYSSLRGLAGIGDYTAAAIASIAFDRPHAVVDGNVIRVLSRFTAEQGNIDSATVRKRLDGFAGKILDPKRPGEFNQALMELGATVCLPKQPQCSRCPLAKQCQARARALASELPVRSVRVKPISVQKQLVVIEKRGKLLLWQRPAASPRLAGFWELPEVGQLQCARIDGQPARFRHTIVNTNYSFEVYRGIVGRRPKGFEWLPLAQIRQIPLSTTAKKALASVAKSVTYLSEHNLIER